MSEEPEGVAAGDSGGGEVKKTGTKGLGKGAARGRGRGKRRGGGDRSVAAPAMDGVAVGDRVLRERRHPPNVYCERDIGDDEVGLEMISFPLPFPHLFSLGISIVFERLLVVTGVLHHILQLCAGT
jgi:hypothetical protein